MNVKSILKNNGNSISVRKGDKVSSVIGSLERSSSHFAYAKDGQKFLGVVDFNSMLKSRMNIESVKIDSFINQVSALSSSQSLEEAAVQMINSDSFVLPVMDNDEFLGALDVLQVLANIDKSSRLNKLKVDDTDIIHYAVAYDDPAGTVLSHMRKNKLRVVPVLSNGKVSGVVSVVDLLSKYYKYHLGQDHGQKAKTKTRGFNAQKESVLDLPIGNFMSENFVILNGQETLIELAKKLSDKKSLIAVSNDGSWYGAGSIISKLAEKEEQELRNVFFSGLDSLQLHKNELKRMHDISEGYVQRIQDYLNKEFNIRIHIKATRKSGSQKLYELSARLEYAGPPISANTQGWDIKAALRNAYDQIIKQIENSQKQYDVSGIPKESEIKGGASR